MDREERNDWLTIPQGGWAMSESNMGESDAAPMPGSAQDANGDTAIVETASQVARQTNERWRTLADKAREVHAAIEAVHAAELNVDTVLRANYPPGAMARWRGAESYVHHGEVLETLMGRLKVRNASTRRVYWIHAHEVC